MSLYFQPLREDQVSNLLQAGNYNFQVKYAEDTISKSGNAMIKVTLSVWDNAGKERHINDYLLTSLMYKLKHFCDAVGLEDKYSAGKISAEDCIGKSGKCKIKVEESGAYPAKNSVQDYVKVDAESDNKQPVLIDDDIPF